MPTYVYACKNCAYRFEKYQSFSEDSLVTCPECAQDALRKVFDSVGIVFKGPGFYSTDSQSTATSARSSGSSDGEGSSSQSASSGESGSSDAASSSSSSGADKASSTTQAAPAAAAS